MSDEDENIFNEEGMPNADEIAMETYASMVAALYRSLKAQDLTVQEAASLTAALISHSMPAELRGPRDGS